MNTYSIAIASVKIYKIPPNTYNLILSYYGNETIILPSLYNSLLGFYLTIINFSTSNKTIINEDIQVDVIEPNQAITYAKSIDNTGFWIKTNYSTVVNKASADPWSTAGNTGTNLLLGTTDNNDYSLIRNNIPIFTIQNGINMLSNKIFNLLDPVNAQDAATKTYVDGIGGNAWKSTGNTFVGGKLGTTTPNLWNMIYNGNTVATVGPTTITGIPPPSAAGDVVPKTYVDGNFWNLNGNTGVANMKIGTIGNANGFSMVVNNVSRMLLNNIRILIPVTSTGVGSLVIGSSIVSDSASIHIQQITYTGAFYTGSHMGIKFTHIGDTPAKAWYMGYSTSDVFGIYFQADENGTCTRVVSVQLPPFPTQFTYGVDNQSNRLVNVLTPTAATDAANKAYVDAIGNNSWSIVGNTTATGKLGTTTLNTWTLIYNNATIATVGPTTITGVPPPIAGTDVVNKNYIDTGFWPILSDTGNGFRLGPITNNGLAFITNNIIRVTISNAGRMGMPLNSGITIGTSGADSSQLYIQQQSFAQELYVNSHYGIKFTVSGNTPAKCWYMGYAASDTFGIFYQADVNGTCTKVINVQGPSLPTQFTYGVDNRSNRLINVLTPVAPTDAANKAYVDAAVGGTGSWSIAGNTGAGNKLGTTDNNSINVIANNNTQMTINDGNITIANNLLFGAVGADSARICIKQTAALDTTTTNTGIKFIAPSSTNGWYMGINAGGAFTLFNQTTSGNTAIAIFNNSLSRTIFPFGLDNALNTLINVNTPVNPTDAANKAYVDNAGNNKWSISGNTGPGNKLGTTSLNSWDIICNNTALATVGPTTITGINAPLNPTDVANKLYVDAVGSFRWHVAGNTGGGNKLGTTSLNTWEMIYNNSSIATIGPTTITGVPPPIASSDVATKFYVDSNISNFWSRSGNTGTPTTIGTIDNNPINIIANNITQLTVNNGNLTLPTTQNILVGSPGTDFSRLCIKQNALLSSSVATSHDGIKFINTTGANAWYFGYATGGTFSVFYQDSVAGTCFNICNFNIAPIQTQFLYGLDNNNVTLINVATPINNTDAANKLYADRKYVKYLGGTGIVTNTTVNTFLTTSALLPTLLMVVTLYTNAGFTAFKTSTAIVFPVTASQGSGNYVLFNGYPNRVEITISAFTVGTSTLSLNGTLNGLTGYRADFYQ